MAGGTVVGGANTVPVYTGERPSDSGSLAPFDGDEPTDEEKATLRHVGDKLPWSTFLVAIVELCERFAYYGLSGPFQNYIQKPYGKGSTPGALGLGQSSATGLGNFFQFWCYVTPILGAVVADQFLGKYNTILYFSLIYITGLVILFTTALPVSIVNGHAFGGLISSMILIGIGTGGIKSNVGPLIAEQYRGTKQTIKTLKSGERVIVDPAITIQRIYMIFYLCVNIGSLSAIATTELELHVGFWAAYLLPFLVFCVGFCVLLGGKKFYIVRPPRGSVITHAFKAMWIALLNKGKMDAAKPSYQDEYGRKYTTPWNDHFIDELKRGLVACKVFIFFPIYWVVYTQMLNNFISQAGQMELHGIPNDIMQNIDPLTIVIFIPIMDRLIYPLLRRWKITFKPITRITMGFFVGSLAMAYAAIVQHLIYQRGPCYEAPLACDAAGPHGAIPNSIHVAVQTPAYLFIGLSEIFASITGLEYAYTKAPPSMKSFVMAIFLLTSAGGSALGIALSPTAKDPKLLWMYTGLGIASFIAGISFWFTFKRYNATEEEMNELERHGDKAVPANMIDATGKNDVESQGASHKTSLSNNQVQMAAVFGKDERA
ncbi:MAG: peptide transporter ptr2 [Candelina submexicana]|nr:MAG: peptide transporter ptr2 [Candelina submexicana]